jgi:hypothetical protein
MHILHLDAAYIMVGERSAKAMALRKRLYDHVREAAKTAIWPKGD